MLSRLQKQEVVEDLKGIFNTYKFIGIFHYKGLSVDILNSLRDIMYKNSCSIKVVKNSLATIAADGTICEAVKDLLVGPTAMVWSDDPTGTSKILVSFAKKNQELKIVGGVFNGNLLGESDVVNISNLPSLPQLQSRLIAVIQAPATKIACVVSRPATMIAGVLAAYSKK